MDGHDPNDGPMANAIAHDLDENGELAATSDEGAAGEENGQPDTLEDDVRNLRTQYQRLRDHLQNNRDAQSLIRLWLEVLPFLLIFLCKFIEEHAPALYYLLLSMGTFLIVDSRLQSILAKTVPGRSYPILIACILAHFFIQSQNPDITEMWYGLSFQYTQLQYVGAMHTLLLIVLTDLLCKVVIVAIKAMLTLIPDMWLSLKRKRRLFQTIEYTSHLYRALLPISRWTRYFIGNSPDGITYFDLALLIFYWCAKVNELWRYIPDCLSSLKMAVRNTSSGVRPSYEELSNVRQCSICLSDMKNPIKLICSHIFCEECVETWLEEKHTCPMCRTTLDKEDKSWKTGATSKLVRFY
ncbi:unnamed protein product, partial [Mesorhabditis spiculigera]